MSNSFSPVTNQTNMNVTAILLWIDNTVSVLVALFCQVGARDIKEAEDSISRAEEAIRQAQKYIVEEGRKALQEAQAASEKFGQQSSRMSEIAREAREEAER